MNCNACASGSSRGCRAVSGSGNYLILLDKGAFGHDGAEFWGGVDVSFVKRFAPPMNQTHETFF